MGRSMMITQWQTLTCSITIDYKDDSNGGGGVSGAEFSLNKVADLVTFINQEGSTLSGAAGASSSEASSSTESTDASATDSASSDETSSESVSQGSTASESASSVALPSSIGGATYETLIDGVTIDYSTDDSAIEGMDQGVYLGVETKPADGHFASAPFLVSLPWSDGSV